MVGDTKITYIDLHCHSEYSIKDGKIRVMNHDDPTGIKEEIVIKAIERNLGAVTMTDHGNMYGHAQLAKVAKAFGLKHIPACEFYLATDHRTDKNYAKKSDSYYHINAWAKNKEGYRNMCILSKIAYTEGFYYEPRIDMESILKYGDGIMWSDACIGGKLSAHILRGEIDKAYDWFLVMLDRFRDDFFIEYHNHNIPEEDMVNVSKVEMANKHGVPIIACTDAHFYSKDDEEAHKTLLTIQYANWLDNPLFEGFPGDGYWMMNNDELLERYPVEYLNNTKLLVDKCEGNIIEFGKIVPPRFKVPQWFIDRVKEGAKI